MKRFWTFLVRMAGWKFVYPEGEHPEWHHAVFIEAPHTAASDFFLGAAMLWTLGLNVRIFVKKEFFNKFTNAFLRRCGCVPIDRGNPANHMVDKAVQLFHEHADFTLLITPEGTRQWVRRWKRGFYNIAVQAQVPIVLTYIDYKTRRMGVGPSFYPTGNWDEDIRVIMQFYQDKTARHPQQFNKNANLS